MFKIEVKFKVADREVSWEKFAASFLAEAFRSVQNEVPPQSASTPLPVVFPRPSEGGKSL